MDTPLHMAAGHASAMVAPILDIALSHRGSPFAITGLQGSGKSTLASQVAAAAARRGLRVAVLSIDDFYLDRPVRRRLATRVHPLLATRGPPGTHEVALACEVIDALLAGTPVALPRFDKIADRRLPRSQWPLMRGCDLVIFEGWFLRTPAEAGVALAEPLNAVEHDDDPEGVWRHYVNDALATHYTPLWSRLPRLLLLQAPSFDVVPGWRWQQEQSLQAANPGRMTMDRAQVERFVQLFERVSRQALRMLPASAEHVVRLDAMRHPAHGDILALRAAPTIAG